MIGNKYAILDISGKILTSFQFDNIIHYKRRDAYLVKNNSKFGFLNLNRVDKVVYKYDKHILLSGRGAYKVRDGYKWGLVDSTGVEFLPCNFDWIDGYDGDFALVEQERKYGIINHLGKIIVPVNYKRVDIDSDPFRFFDSEIKALKIDGKYGFVDNTGREIIPFILDEIGSFGANFADVKQNNKYALIDRSGNLITSFEYDRLIVCSERGGAIGIRSGEYLYLDDRGEIKIRQADNIKEDTSNELLIVSSDSAVHLYDYSGTPITDSLYIAGFIKENFKSDYNFENKCWGFKDISGKAVIPYEYDWCSSFRSGYAAVAKKGFLGKHKFGIIDTNNEQVIPVRYDWAEILGDNRCILKKGGKYAFSDCKGNLFTPFQYTFVKSVTDYLYRVGAGNKRGIVNSRGEVKLPIVFNNLEIERVEGSWTELKLIIGDGKRGLLNSDTDEVPIACIYDDLKVENDSIIMVKQEGKWGCFDAGGKERVSIMYDGIKALTGLYVLVLKDGKRNVVNLKTGETLPRFYNELSVARDKYIIARDNDKWGVSDISGEILVPFEYDGIQHYYNDLFIVQKRVSESQAFNCCDQE